MLVALLLIVPTSRPLDDEELDVLEDVALELDGLDD
jgi:hypothetical protein